MLKLLFATLLFCLCVNTTYAQQKIPNDTLIKMIPTYYKEREKVWAWSDSMIQVYKNKSPYLTLFYIEINKLSQGIMYGNGNHIPLAWFDERDKIEFYSYMQIGYNYKALQQIMGRDENLCICDRKKEGYVERSEEFKNTVKALREILKNIGEDKTNKQMYQMLINNMVLENSDFKERYPILKTSINTYEIRLPDVRHCLDAEINVLWQKLKTKSISRKEYVEKMKKLNYMQYTIFYDVLMLKKEKL
jgi:hypothetical protein